MQEWIFQTAEATSLGAAIRGSQYWFPLVESTHLMALGFLLGSVFLFNARFFGLGMRRQTPAEVAHDFTPWTRRALYLMAASGTLLFLAKAGELYAGKLREFQIKMTLIALAVVFHFTIQQRLARSSNMLLGRLAAAAALLMWFGAAVAGLTLEFL
jgi:hypothetical protein